MLKTEKINEQYCRTFSDAGFCIRGGFPEGIYADAIDPIDSERTYTETDIPIDEGDEEATAADYQAALRELGVNIDEETNAEN